jgi:hypothetical protein
VFSLPGSLKRFRFFTGYWTCRRGVFKQDVGDSRMPAYYLDTNIWLDHYENRGKRGKTAKRLFRKLIAESAIVYYSDLHIKELKRVGYTLDEIRTIFRVIQPKNTRHAQIRETPESVLMTIP